MSRDSQHDSGQYRVIESPLGDFTIRIHSDGAISSGWLSGSDVCLEDPAWTRSKTILPDLADAMTRYFNGEPNVDFSCAPTPQGPPFYTACWNAARTIPAGEVITYGELAEWAGSLGAARAAGQAMRNNQLPIIIPCHRVIGSGNALHGYSGTTDAQSESLCIKRYLLGLEGHPLGDAAPLFAG